MDIPEELVTSYINTFTVAEIREFHRQAMVDLSSGVIISNLSLGDGGNAAGQVISAPPGWLVQLFQRCLTRIENPDSGAPKPLASRLTFSRRRTET